MAIKDVLCQFIMTTFLPFTFFKKNKYVLIGCVLEWGTRNLLFRMYVT